MNIHPLIVHFPIALLTIYSLLEVGAYCLPALRRQEWISPVKSFLLFVGVLAVFAGLVTGGIAEELLGGPETSVLEMHSSFAGATAVLYFFIAAAYLVRIFDTKGWGDRIVGTHTFLIRIWGGKKYIARHILDTWFLPVLALLAFASMTVTGALGAVLVYGPNIDPFVSFIYHVFWP